MNTLLARFINNFVKLGNNPSTYKLRTEILSTDNNHIFKKKLLLNGVQQLDCQCNTTYIISKIFTNLFSAIDNYQCSSKSCKNVKQRKIIDMLPININIMKSSKFNLLETAINDGILKISKCKCSKTVNHVLTLSSNIFIDTNDCGFTALSNLPCSIKIFDKIFFLRSVVAFVNNLSDSNGIGHYISYCRRLYAMWEKYDDLKKNVENVDSNNLVQPHLILYTI